MRASPRGAPAWRWADAAAVSVQEWKRLRCTLTPVEGCRRCKVAPHMIVKTWPRLLVAGVPGEAHQASVPLSTFIPHSRPHLLTPVPAHPLNKLPDRRPQRPLHISPPPSSHPQLLNSAVCGSHDNHNLQRNLCVFVIFFDKFKRHCEEC